jgi:hypothetical protein
MDGQNDRPTDEQIDKQVKGQVNWWADQQMD